MTEVFPVGNVSFGEQNGTSRRAICALGARSSPPFSQPCSDTAAGVLSLLELILPEGSLTPSSAHPAIKATQMRLQDRFFSILKEVPDADLGQFALHPP